MPARGHRAWRVRLRGARARRRYQIAGQGALSAAGVRLDRILYRRTYRLQPRFFQRGAVGSAAVRRGDRQHFQWRRWRRAGRLQLAPAIRPAARRRGRSDLSELSAFELDYLPADLAQFRRHPFAGLCRNGARPPRLRHQSLAVLRHRRIGLRGRALHQHARRRQRRKASSTSGSVGPPAPVSNMALRRTGVCGSNISTASTSAPTSAFRRARSIPPRSISSRCASGSTARSIGRARRAWTPKHDADRSGIRPLGNPRPDHLSAAGLSGLPRALQRHQQPDAGAAGAGDLEQQPVSQHAALGRRRGLLQSRTAAGIRTERHRRRRRLPNGEAQKSNFPYPHYNTSRLFCRQTFGFGGEQEDIGERRNAARRQGRCQPADRAGRQIRR